MTQDDNDQLKQLLGDVERIRLEVGTKPFPSASWGIDDCGACGRRLNARKMCPDNMCRFRNRFVEDAPLLKSFTVPRTTSHFASRFASSLSHADCCCAAHHDAAFDLPIGPYHYGITWNPPAEADETTSPPILDWSTEPRTFSKEELEPKSPIEELD